MRRSSRNGSTTEVGNLVFVRQGNCCACLILGGSADVFFILGQCLKHKLCIMTDKRVILYVNCASVSVFLSVAYFIKFSARSQARPMELNVAVWR